MGSEECVIALYFVHSVLVRSTLVALDLQDDVHVDSVRSTQRQPFPCLALQI